MICEFFFCLKAKQVFPSNCVKIRRVSNKDVFEGKIRTSFTSPIPCYCRCYRESSGSTQDYYLSDILFVRKYVKFKRDSKIKQELNFCNQLLSMPATNSV